MRQKMLSVMLTLAVCLSLLSAMTLTASAKTASVKYLTCDKNGQSWETVIRSAYTAVTSSQTQWTGGWYVADRSVTLANRTVTVIGDVHLILKNGCSLTITGPNGASGGIEGAGANGGDGSVAISILSGSSLTIYGQEGHSGELKVIGGSGGSGANGSGGSGGNGGDGADAITGNVTIYGGNVIVSGGDGGSGGVGDKDANGRRDGNGGRGGSGGSAVTGRVAVYGGSFTGDGGSGGRGGGSYGTGGGISGGDGKAVNGSISFADGYIHLTRAGDDPDTAGVAEWTGSYSGFPLEANWVKIQPMRINGVTVSSSAARVIPGETVNLTARIAVLTPSGVDPLIVTAGAAWTVTGGKSYAITDGKLTVKTNETSEALTVTAQYAGVSGSATVNVEQSASAGDLTGVEKIGDTTLALPDGGTALPNQNGAVSVPAGTIVIPPVGSSFTVNTGAIVDENGGITLPGGGSATINGTTIIVSAQGGTITPNEDGTVSLPAAAKITRGSGGKRTTVPAQGGILNLDGTYEDNVYANPVFRDAPPTYPPTVLRPVNGAAAVSPRFPGKGDTVTITPTPNGNYELGDVVVRDSSGNRLEVKDNRDGTYSFVQPGEIVTVEATFLPRSQALPFFDVLPNSWCYEAVRYVNSRGIMGGYSDGFFRPNAQLSRAMLAQVLCNLAGGVGASSQTRYNDVPADAWYAEAVRWAAGEGIITGYSDGSFRPDAPITREQFAVMLYRFRQSQGGADAGGQTPDYADAGQIGAYAREAVAWCGANDILGGYGDGTLRPKEQTTRAQAAAMLMRFCERT